MLHNCIMKYSAIIISVTILWFRANLCLLIVQHDSAENGLVCPINVVDFRSCRHV